MATKKKTSKARGGDAVAADALGAAIDEAVGGDTDSLFSLLAQGGGTDRGGVNMELAQAFAREVAARGDEGDDLIEEMAALDDVDAEEGSAEEFLSICGLLAHGERAALDAGRIDAAKEALERTAQDPRERLQSAAAATMTRMGQGHGPKLLVDHFSKYLGTTAIDSYVLAALARRAWLDTFASPEPIIVKLDQIFTQLAKSGPLLEKTATAQRTMKVLESAPAAMAEKFPEAIAAFFDKWATDTGKRIPRIIAANRR
jgi:uncharacterized membrane protein YccC